MKLKLLCVLPVALLAVGCSTQAEKQAAFDVAAKDAVSSVLADLERQREAGIDTRPFRFQCGSSENIVVSYRLPAGASNSQAIVTPNGGNADSYTLPKVQSASGERYSDGTNEWATKGGNDGMLTINGKSLSCTLTSVG